MKINLHSWSLEMNDSDYSISKVKYKNLSIIDHLSLDNFDNGIADGEIQRLMKLNYLEPMPKFLNKFQKIADMDLSTNKKISWRMNGKAWLSSGAIHIRRNLEVSKEGIVISFEFKLQKPHYNLFKTKVVISDELTSMFKIYKEKKIWNKEKVDSRKTFYLNNKYPLLVNTKLGESFFINSSFKSITKNNNQMIFIPKKDTSEKEIIKSWKIKSKLYYQINFAIKINDKKIHF